MKASFSSAWAGAWLLATTLATPFTAEATIGPAGGLTGTISGNDVVLSFPTTSTNYYGLQARSGFSQSWSNIQAGLQGYGSVKTVILTNAVLSGQGYYQTLIQPPPTPLLLPPAIAFAILGYDCGGIQEQVAAIGFDPTNGYPTGIVDLKTSCSTGGRGSHPALHTAAVAVTWDFAGNVIATNPPTTGAGNSTFIATDAFGDILYNAGVNAYLIVPVPAAPAGVAAVQSGDQFQVVWTPVGGNPLAITASTLTATPINSTNSILTATVTGPVTNGVIPALQPQTTYQVIVVNTTLGGAGPASTPLDVTTEVAAVTPSAPTTVGATWLNLDPTATDPAATNDTLSVTWSAAVPGDSPVDEYQITITGSDGAGTFTQTVSGATLGAYFTVNFTPNWTVTVQAHNAAGWSPASTPVSRGGL